jgi:hypothetical protein
MAILKTVVIMDLINYHSEVLFGVVPAVSHNVMLSALKYEYISF